MGINERREREKTERRNTILDCARELILELGVSRVSIEEIARRAELSKATVYLYFSSKEILLREICEASAKVFLEHFSPFLETGVSGMDALRCFWRGYAELFGSSDEMIIVFEVYRFLNSGDFDYMSKGKGVSSHVDAILAALRGIIDQCKAEGVFDPGLDTAMVTRLVLSIFFQTIEKAARMPKEQRKSPVIIEEMTAAFQLIIRGIAKEGVSFSALDLRK